MKTPLTILATSMLARMKFVLVQSLGVSWIVVSVNPLPPRLIMDKMRIMATLKIIWFATETFPVRLPVSVSVVVASMLLKLTSDDSIIITSSLIVPFCTIEYDSKQINNK